MSCALIQFKALWKQYQLYKLKCLPLPNVVHQIIYLICFRRLPFWKLVLKTIQIQTFSWTKLILNLLSIIVHQYLKVMGTILRKIVLQGQCYSISFGVKHSRIQQIPKFGHYLRYFLVHLV